MGTLYEKIINLCENKGVSGSRMCVDLGLSKSTLSDLKKGRTKGISVPTAQKIAGYFGISVDELYGRDSAESEKKTTIQTDDDLSETHMKLIELAKNLSVEDAAMLLAALQAKQQQ